jgi:hypothetical protein
MKFEGSDKIAEALADYFHSVYDVNVRDLDEGAAGPLFTDNGE